MEKENKGIKLRCPSEKCKNYVWKYKGKAIYACCPRCHNSVNIQKHEVKK